MLLFTQTTHVDIQRGDHPSYIKIHTFSPYNPLHTDLHINLLEEIALLSMLKRNPWIEQRREQSGSSVSDERLVFRFMKTRLVQ